MKFIPCVRHRSRWWSNRHEQGAVWRNQRYEVNTPRRPTRGAWAGYHPGRFKAWLIDYTSKVWKRLQYEGTAWGKHWKKSWYSQRGGLEAREKRGRDQVLETLKQREWKHGGFKGHGAHWKNQGFWLSSEGVIMNAHDFSGRIKEPVHEWSCFIPMGKNHSTYSLGNYEVSGSTLDSTEVSFLFHFKHEGAETQNGLVRCPRSQQRSKGPGSLRFPCWLSRE